MGTSKDDKGTERSVRGGRSGDLARGGNADERREGEERHLGGRVGGCGFWRAGGLEGGSSEHVGAVEGTSARTG